VVMCVPKIRFCNIADERPRCSAAKGGHQSSPSDVDCMIHGIMTMQCGGRYHALIAQSVATKTSFLQYW
jgi:hypothetical protein